MWTTQILELRFDQGDRRASRHVEEEQSSHLSDTFAKYTDEQIAEAYRRVVWGK